MPNPDMSRLVTFFERHGDEFDPATGDVKKTSPRTHGRSKRSVGTKHLSACLPFIADVRDSATYATWPVWSGGTTRQTRFVPMPKKTAMRIYHKAAKWNARSKRAGCHGGVIGSHVLLVLHTLIFEFLNYGTGRSLTRPTSRIQKKTRLCRQIGRQGSSRNLADLGIINWIQRCRRDHDEDGRFCAPPDHEWLCDHSRDAMARLCGLAAPERAIPQHLGEPHCPCPRSSSRRQPPAQDGDSMTAIIRRLDADPGDTLASTPGAPRPRPRLLKPLFYRSLRPGFKPHTDSF